MMHLPPATADLNLPPSDSPDAGALEGFPGQVPRPGWKSWYSPRNLIATALVAIVVYFAPGFTGPPPLLVDRPEFLVPAERIEVNQPPRWVPRTFKAEAVRIGQLPQDLSLLSPTLMEDVRAAFHLHPWVEEVISITARSPAGLSVKLRYRQPVAMVETPWGLYPIDASGVLLPPENFSVSDASDFPIVGKVTSTPQGPAGTPWGDDRVLGAARLAQLLTTRWKPLGLERIDCPSSSSSSDGVPGDAYLLLCRGSVIVWGSAELTQPGELSADQRLRRLDKYHGDFGGFDKPHGPYLIDIRHWQEISRRPLGPLVHARR